MRQLTSAPHNHILTNAGAWSADGRWVVYDVRSDEAGSVFDGTRIERVNVETGEVQRLYESGDGACCGVATCSPVSDEVAFILGPERPGGAWTYGPDRRRGVIVRASEPGVVRGLDARDLAPPYTAGALRGGSHVHVFSGDGRLVSFTYDDHVLAGSKVAARNVGVAVAGHPVVVPKRHERNHDGTHFGVLVTRTTPDPRPGSDEIARAFEDAWVGVEGYVRPDGSRQRRAIAFQGEVLTAAGRRISEAFIVDVPDDVTRPGAWGPLEGTATALPAPPAGTMQRRLTFTEGRRYPGLQGPRHWLRSSPDGSRIAFLMRDEDGVVQLWTVSPNGGPPAQVTGNRHDVASAFTWGPDGGRIAHAMDGSVCVTDVGTGRTERLTEPDRGPGGEGGQGRQGGPLALACLFSPDGRRIAYLRRRRSGRAPATNQVFVVESSPAGQPPRPAAVQ